MVGENRGSTSMENKDRGDFRTSIPSGSAEKSPLQQRRKNGTHLRPRGVFTAQNYGPRNNFNVQRIRSDFGKYLGSSVPLPEWGGNNNGMNKPRPFYSSTGIFVPSASRSNSKGSLESLSHAYKTIIDIDAEEWASPNNNVNNQMDEQYLGAIVTSNGLLQVNLHSGIRVFLTVDKAIRVVNYSSGVILSLSANGSNAALIHPSGCVYQYGSRVEIKTFDMNGNDKFAKMWYKGISFSSEHNALVYLVDTAGTRSTSDCFSDLGGDITLPVFLTDAQFGVGTIPDCAQLLQLANYWVTEEGIENWVINGIRISQTPDGMVRVARGQTKYQMRTSPTNGTASLSTPYVHATASCGTSRHMFVKRGERRMHFDGASFIVRNAGHSSGFDENGKLKVY